MEHNGNTAGKQARPFKPDRDYLEVLRRSKLTAILWAVQRVLVHDGAPASAELQHLVTLCVAELSTIERVDDAKERMPEWVAWIEDSLGIDPFEAYALWTTHAPGPIEIESARWHAHKAQAVLKAEPKRFFHAKLVDPAAISASLNLSRKRIRDVFGSDKCVLPPITVRKGRFPQETMAKLRALAKEVKRTPEYLGDILEAQGEAGLHSVIETWRADIAKFSTRPRKRGRKVDPTNLTNAVKDTAKQLRKSERTIWNRLRDKGAESPESGVTFAVESCHVCSGTARSAIPEFCDVFSVTETPGFDVTEMRNDKALDILAEVGMKEKRGRRNPYRDRALIIRWWEATRGETPSPDRIRKWSQRGQYFGYMRSAQAWQTLASLDMTPIDTAPEISPEIAAFAFGEELHREPVGALSEHAPVGPAQDKESRSTPATHTHGRP